MRSQIGMMILYLVLTIGLMIPARADSDGTTNITPLRRDTFGPAEPKHTHVPGDDWIMRGDKRNPAGEWCCGEGDCFVIPADLVRSRSGGLMITLMDYLGYGQDEFIPDREVQPSPDGRHWRCKRPDGSRRCFFAPPPAT